MSYQPDEAAIRARVAKRIRGRIFFGVHLALGFPLLLLIRTVPAVPDYGYGAKPVVVGALLMIWAVTFIGHALLKLYHWWVERAVRQEMEREYHYYSNTEKLKNSAYYSTPLRLADDGELPDTQLADGAEPQKLKRQSEEI